jgi:inosine-uridine nucleoside N-ribohydrolase
MKKVIFDTDIGIDDAMALLFLHYAPDVELKAIVTGFGNASIENTTRNALYIKDRFQISAPVYRGAAYPLGGGQAVAYPDFVHGKNGLGDIDISEPSCHTEEMTGAQAIVALVQEYPRELSIVAVGRMTNLAEALALCPELPELVFEVVVMGGAFGFNGHSGNVTPVAEANIAGDAVAANRVFSSGIPLTVVGLDVTQETVADAAFFAGLRDGAGDAGDFIYETIRYYVDFHERIHGAAECPIHDSSAVAYLLQPTAFETREGCVSVVTTGDNRGQTIFEAADVASGGQHSSRICTSVDAEAVRELYTSTLRLAAD